MQLINAFTLLTLAVSSVYGSAIDTSVVESGLESVNLESRATTCVTSDVNFIKGRVKHFNVFCQMFNAQTRTASPFLLLNAKKTTAACKCILASWNGKATSTTAPAATATKCVTADSNLIKNEYYYPPAFCTWWNLEARTRTPIPGVSAAEVTKACKCYNAAKASTASTAVKVTTTTKKTTSSTKKATSTTAAACKRRRVRRNAAAAAVSVSLPSEVLAVATSVPTTA